jgi:hypothetical protein
MMKLHFWVAALLTSASPILASDVPDVSGPNPEQFKIELTGSLWVMDAGGSLSSTDTTLDLVRDLGARQNVKTAYGRLVIKPGRKHRIQIDGSPFHLEGEHTATETFSYGGEQFTFSEPLSTRADLAYLYAGYQYDFVTGSIGHFGASIGGAYMDAKGSISTAGIDMEGTREQKIGLPLAGVEFRVFPIPGRDIIDIDGSLRGMDLGHYGHYVEGNVNAGIWIAHHVSLQAGYRDTRALLQNTGSSSDSGRLDIRLHGPIYTLGFKW